MISPLNSVLNSSTVAAVKPLAPASSTDFQSMLNSAIQSVESSRQNAETQVAGFLSGEGQEIHQVVMATQRAELSFELFQGVRNKVVQAYQEIMRMQM